MVDPWPHRLDLAASNFQTPLPAVRLDRVREQARIDAQQHSAAGVNWRPFVVGPVISDLVGSLRESGACGFSCGRLNTAESLRLSGETSVKLTQPPVIGDGPARLARLAAEIRVDVICDHFAQAERLSAACREASSTIGVLVNVDVGRHRLGVRPGPDLSDFVEGLLTLRGLRVAGISVENGDRQGSGVAQMSDEELVHILRAGTRSFRRVGCAANTLSVGRLGRLGEIGDSVLEARTPLSTFRRDIFAVIAGVVGRPTRDVAVIDAGAIELAGHVSDPVATPGVRLTRVLPNHSVLSLEGEAQNLLIGDLIAIPVCRLDAFWGTAVLIGEAGQWRIATFPSVR